MLCLRKREKEYERSADTVKRRDAHTNRAHRPDTGIATECARMRLPKGETLGERHSIKRKGRNKMKTPRVKNEQGHETMWRSEWIHRPYML